MYVASVTLVVSWRQCC